MKALLGQLAFCVILSLLSDSCLVSAVHPRTHGAKNAGSGTDLHLLAIVHRHGERTPYKFFANDPYSDPKYWPDGNVQLTTPGRARMYQLGRSIRERYADFLVDNPRLVYARSSDADRCIESSDLVLHGIFKTTGRWVYSNETSYLPIPIHTVPTATDSMLTTDVNCPEATNEKNRLLHGDSAKSIMAKYEGTLNLIKQKTGNDLGDLTDISDFYATLLIEEENIPDFKRPDWMTAKVMEELRIMSDADAYIAHSSFRIQRFRTSNFFNHLRQHIYAKLENDVSNGGNLKMLSYSTHDKMLASILIALRIFDNKLPTYGATLVFELVRSANNRPAIKVLYWNDTHSEPNEMALPACDNQKVCPVDRFTKFISSFILDDWEAECGLKREPSLWSNGLFVSLVVILGLIIFIGLIWFMGIQCYGVRRGYRSIS